MRIIRRTLAWTFFLGFLWVVGFGVFHFVRYRPRFTIPELLFVQHLSADGSRLVTLKGPRLNRVHDRGPVQVWDTRRGRLEYEFLADMPAWFEFSDDGPMIAAGLEDGTLRLIDWRSGRDWQIEDVKVAQFTQLKERAPWPGHWFSARGRWLYVEVAGDQPTCVVNVATRQIVLSLKEKFLQFSIDGRRAFVRNAADIDVWDLDTVKKAATLATEAQEWITLSPDGRTMLTRRTGPRPGPFEAAPVHSVDVWDLATFTLRFNRQVSPPGYWNAEFSPNGRRLALLCASDFLLVDGGTGQLLCSYTMEGFQHGCFSPDSSLWLLLHGAQNKETLTVFDAARGRVLWEKPGRSALSFFGARGILRQVNDIVELLDAASGDRLGEPLTVTTTENPPFQTPIIRSYLLTESADGRHFAFAGRLRRQRDLPFAESWLARWWPNQFGDDVRAVTVLESATGREVLRLANAGNQSDRLRLSDDAGTLVTGDAYDDGRMVVRVWDVAPTRAWLWAIGAAAATGFALLALRWAWRRRKARKAAATQAVSARN